MATQRTLKNRIACAWVYRACTALRCIKARRNLFSIRNVIVPSATRVNDTWNEIGTVLPKNYYGTSEIIRKKKIFSLRHHSICLCFDLTETFSFHDILSPRFFSPSIHGSSSVPTFFFFKSNEQRYRAESIIFLHILQWNLTLGPRHYGSAFMLNTEFWKSCFAVGCG